MDEEVPLYQRPAFYIVSRLILVSALYAYATYSDWRSGELTPLRIMLDAAVFIILLLIWLAFFAQFVLPVHTFQERRKMFSRLISYLTGLRGPAVFVKNGAAILRSGESERNGPGVLWLDAASGAVTHIDVAFKNTFGPGVHFTSWGEKVSETVDLHTQSQKIGPKDTDNPFEPQGSIPDDIFADVQKRRMMVSALSRDGIEVVPDISVTFKIDADPVRGDRPGSHFGYDEGAVRRAVINQAINPNAKPDTLEYKVAWNELPAALAADLWREYMSKFTLGQLFTPNLVLPAAVPQSQVPPPSPDADALRSPIAGQPQGFLAEALTGMIHELNGILGRLANYVERGEPKLPPIPPPVTASKPVDVGRKTALQLTNYMIKERLTNPFVPSLDANGQRLPGWQESREYWVLKNRGIRLLSVSVSNLRFQPRVEEQLASGWSSNWLMNAQAERERIETARSFAAFSGQEKALTDYAMEISSELLEKKKEKAELKAALRALLIRSRMILVRSDRMHRRAGMELQELEEVLHWLESDPT